jgi:hypothetical protein
MTQPVLQQHAVGHPGERIGQRHLGQLTIGLVQRAGQALGLGAQPGVQHRGEQRDQQQHRRGRAHPPAQALATQAVGAQADGTGRKGAAAMPL